MFWFLLHIYVKMDGSKNVNFEVVRSVRYLKRLLAGLWPSETRCCVLLDLIDGWEWRQHVPKSSLTPLWVLQNSAQTTDGCLHRWHPAVICYMHCREVVRTVRRSCVRQQFLLLVTCFGFWKRRHRAIINTHFDGLYLNYLSKCIFLLPDYGFSKNRKLLQ